MLISVVVLLLLTLASVSFEVSAVLRFSVGSL